MTLKTIRFHLRSPSCYFLVQAIKRTHCWSACSFQAF